MNHPILKPLLLLTQCFLLVSCWSGCGEEESVPKTPAETGPPTLEDLTARIKDPAWQKRLEALELVPGLDGVPAEDRAALLVESIKNEIGVKDPARVNGSYLGISEIIRLQLTRKLGEMSSADPRLLRDQLDDASGAARDHLLISLGYAGDREVAGELRRLLAEASDPLIRMDAARVLGLLEAQEARPELESALTDPYQVRFRDSLGEAEIYPVREQAAGALKRLGVPISRTDDGGFRIGEE